MSHAVTFSDPDMKEALVDLYQDIGGCKREGEGPQEDERMP